MNQFIKYFKEYKLVVSDMRYIDPKPNIYLCYNKLLNKYFCSVYFSKDYIQKQNCEIIYGER